MISMTSWNCFTRYLLAGGFIFVAGHGQYRLIHAALGNASLRAGVAWALHFMLGTLWTHALHRHYTFRQAPRHRLAAVQTPGISSGPERLPLALRAGRPHFYTSTLFHSRMDFFHKMGPALELGRSFVRPEYQKSYSPLLLLWKGIGAFVARNPRYRMLFGPVSINRDYSDLSRCLMATTLTRHSQAKALALMVKPRKAAHLGPIRIRGCEDTTHDVQFQDFKEVCSVVADIEIQQKEVPVLLRQYLNLGGQILSFNIDKLFSDVMDGLIVVDLLQTERKTLERYMGSEGLFTFLAHHYARSLAERPGVMERIA